MTSRAVVGTGSVRVRRIVHVAPSGAVSQYVVPDASRMRQNRCAVASYGVEVLSSAPAAFVHPVTRFPDSYPTRSRVEPVACAIRNPAVVPLPRFGTCATSAYTLDPVRS
jgi:hypothetical protein